MHLPTRTGYSKASWVEKGGAGPRTLVRAVYRGEGAVLFAALRQGLPQTTIRLTGSLRSVGHLAQPPDEVRVGLGR